MLLAPRDDLFALRTYPLNVVGLKRDLLKSGSPGRIRTADQRINSPSLYH
jgi:hypothetical protein